MKTNLNNQPPTFHQYLTSLAKSPNTISSYLSDIDQYHTLLNNQPISRESITQYKLALSNLNLSSTTVNRKLSSLKQYNEYLINTNQIQSSILILKSDYIRIQNIGNPTSIAEKTVLTFLSRVKTKPCIYQSRNIAIIYLMANTGIRREETCNLKLEYINSSNEQMKVMGKGNKERTVALNPKAISVINFYLKDRAKHKHANSEYLFLSERGQKLTKESINGIYEDYSTPKCKVNPHALRHNWCSSMLENGILSIVELKNQAGHSSITTTELYTHARLDKIKQKVRGYSIG